MRNYRSDPRSLLLLRYGKLIMLASCRATSESCCHVCDPTAVPAAPHAAGGRCLHLSGKILTQAATSEREAKC